jgi:hypothetical protein
MSDALSEPPSPQGRRATRQAFFVIALAIGLVAIGIRVARAPDNADETKIVVAQWRSLGAESELVSAHATALPARFVRAHAKHLAHAAQDADEALSRLHPRPDVAVDLAQVKRCADGIAASIRSLQHEGGRPDAGCTDRLQQIERALER